MDASRAANNAIWCVLLARCPAVVRDGAMQTAFGSAMFLARKRERHAPYLQKGSATDR